MSEYSPTNFTIAREPKTASSHLHLCIFRELRGSANLRRRINTLYGYYGTLYPDGVFVSVGMASRVLYFGHPSQEYCQANDTFWKSPPKRV